jgi:hypothetical protein
MHSAEQRALHDALRLMKVREFWVEGIEPPVFRNPFDRYRRVFSGYSQQIAAAHASDPISFLFLNRSDFNAVAFRHDSYSFIGMNWGAIILLQDLFLRLLASPAVLPHIGNVSLEQNRPKLPKLQVDAAALPHIEGMPFGITTIPECLARVGYAQFLTQIALDFLFIHEHQHAGGGHLEYSTDLCQQVAEVQDDAAFKDILTRHVLEFEADAAAANFSLKIACDMKGNTWRITEEARPFLSTLDSRLNAWMFAVFALFVLIERADSLRTNSPTQSTHPSPILMRSFFAMIVLSRQVPIDPEAALSRSAGYLDTVHRGIRAITEESLSTTFTLELIAPSRNTHMQALGRQWQRMYPALERLGVPTGTCPAPKDLIELFITS